MYPGREVTWKSVGSSRQVQGEKKISVTEDNMGWRAKDSLLQRANAKPP